MPRGVWVRFPSPARRGCFVIKFYDAASFFVMCCKHNNALGREKSEDEHKMARCIIIPVVFHIPYVWLWSIMAWYSSLSLMTIPVKRGIVFQQSADG